MIDATIRIRAQKIGNGTGCGDDDEVYEDDDEDEDDSNGGHGNDMATSQESLTENNFFCRLDSAPAIKDYLRGGLCVRFSGISATQFATRELGDNVAVQCLDVDLWALRKYLYPGKPTVTATNLGRVQALEDEGFEQVDAVVPWFRITLTPDPEGTSYVYRHFGGESFPPRFSLANVERVNVASNQPPDDVVKQRGEDELVELVQAPSGSSKPYSFHAFHVGQGMCSLVDNGKLGFLLDAGAGTPVTRRVYKMPGMKNELMTRMKDLDRVIFVLSHPDSDHWRLLSWDLGLLSQVNLALVPSGVPLVAFFDSSIKSKVRAIDDLSLDLGGGQSLDIFRSMPATRDRNGDGLVCVFSGQSGGRILAAGDYVYKRYLTDKNPSIVSLAGAAFSGLQVPHHGDEESAFSVPSAVSATSNAFFSAGDHKGYGHPTANSQAAHKAFNKVTDTTLVEIKAMLLG